MARRKKKTQHTLQSVARSIERGFAAVTEDMADIRNHMATGFTEVRKEMATKADIAGIMAELADIKRRLKDLEETSGGSCRAQQRDRPRARAHRGDRAASGYQSSFEIKGAQPRTSFTAAIDAQLK